MRKFGLIGYPLSHSFSQKFFTSKFEALGIDAVYENFPIENIEDLLAVIKAQPDLVGLNVTIPYKTSVIKLLDDIDDQAKSIQAVNTIKIERNGSDVKLLGCNTDVIGFKDSIEQHTKGHQQALIIGTGGAAKAVYHVLTDMDIQCDLVSRNPELGDYIYEDLTEEIIWEYTIIVNCTPLGMYPNVAEAPDIPYDAITPEHVLYDLIYNPQETLFLKKGKAKGATCINGLKMLEIQAEKSWEIWNKS
ncbi:shikimate dehydrogenase family protein [Bacteroidota bacterium]